MLAAMAALDKLIKEEKKEKSKKNQSFSDKLKGFKSIRNQLDGVQLNNPEEQAIVEEFMRNYDTISRKYNQLQQAKDQLEALKKKKENSDT
jgi:prefoldin subunit 5